MFINKKVILGLFAACVLLCGVSKVAIATTGAIFTTDVVCNGTNVNTFPSKDVVYVDGGPHHGGSAGLNDGYYYVQVTEPNGTLLGTSVGSATPTPIHVTDGSFDQCYQLSAIVFKASDNTQGYDTTSNNGGEYKVWVSSDSSFPGGSTKTDNFKVDTTPSVTPSVTPSPTVDPCANNATSSACLTPTATPSATPTVTETPTPTPGSGCTSNCGGDNGGSSNNSSNNSSNSSSPTQAVLAASTLASTGTFTENLMNSLIVLGMIVLSLGGLSYAKENR